MSELFEGFDLRRIDVGEVTLRVRVGGSGPGLLLLALRATDGDLGRLFDVLPIWRDWADDVSGGPIASGHYLPEENPDDVLAVLLPFLSESDNSQDH